MYLIISVIKYDCLYPKSELFFLNKKEQVIKYTLILKIAFQKKKTILKSIPLNS